jgi:hypothetical protein
VTLSDPDRLPLMLRLLSPPVGASKSPVLMTPGIKFVDAQFAHFGVQLLHFGLPN